MMSIENQAQLREDTITERDLRMLENEFGGRFISKPSIDCGSLRTNVTASNPGGEPGASGTFDYNKRIVFVDVEKIKARGEFSVQDVKIHELLHILEIDLIGAAPIHSHLTHVVSDGPVERKRILGMSRGISEAPVKDFLFPEDPQRDISLNEEKLRDTIVLVEDAIKARLNGQKTELSDRETILLALAAMDLGGLKTVYFANKLASPKMAIAFEKACKELLPEHRLAGNINMFKFTEEIALLQETIKNRA